MPKKKVTRKVQSKKITRKIVAKKKIVKISAKKSLASTKKELKKREAIINKSFSENAQRMMKKRYLAQRSDGTQETPSELFHRVSRGLAVIEKNYGKSEAQVVKFEKDFFNIMANKEFTPAGRTLTNVGAGTPIIANCIVMPVLDTLDDIFQTLKESALLQQAGCGLGFSFSSLRPAGTPTKRTNGMSSGPVEFLRIYNTAFGIIKQQGRHGANMGIMRVDHPDILDFIKCKNTEGDIRNFNISVGITDKFMEAVINRPEEPWLATFNGKKMKPRKILRAGNGSVVGFEELDITAKEIFNELVEGAWQNGEPGVVNLDEANRTNPLPKLGEIDATNPCGEQFLHHYDVCNLGSINLSAFVEDKKINWQRLRHATSTAIRALDNVIDLYEHPVKKVDDRAQANRRIGLGVMGFADMLFKLGVAYNSEAGRKLAEKTMSFVNKEAHKASQSLAKEKGEFANFSGSIFSKGKKMRNAALTTVAPTGSISMFTDCSSGIEPEFALYFTKQDKDGEQYQYLNPLFKKALKEAKIDIKNSGVMEELARNGSIQGLMNLPEALRKTFVVSMDISAEDHVKMQAAFQMHTDNSISKTINFPNSATREDIAEGYILAWKLKCKGMTFYRDGSRQIEAISIGDKKMKSITSSLDESKEVAKVKEESMNLAVDQNRISPRVRPDVVSGRTYKVKTGYGNLYVTINNDESGAPLEVFATLGKSGGYFQEQSEGLCRLISTALRSRIKVEEIIKELKGIRGPMPVMTNRGTILSLPDAIAQVLEEHVAAPVLTSTPTITPELVPAPAPSEVNKDGAKTKIHLNRSLADFGMMPQCPDCGGNLVLQEGCMACKSCGFSRCG